MLLAELKNAPNKVKASTVWVIVHTADKVVLGKRAPSANNPNQWNFFGGHVDAGETDLQAAVRELEEETGYKTAASKLRKLVTIGDATYFALEVSSTSGFDISSEVSKVKAFKVADLPNNLHSKTDTFFDKVDWLLR